MKNKIRFDNLDLLRIISCVFVVLIHVTAIWLSNNEVINNDNLFFFVFVNSIAKFSVPVFFMLSGFFNLSNDKNLNYKEFYKKSFYKILLPCILFSVFYSIIKVLECFFSDGDFVLVLKEIFSGNLGALWFLYALIPMYLLTPLIIILKNNIEKKHFIIFCIIYFLYSSVSGLFSEFSVAWSLGNSFNYLGFYLIGYVIGEKFINSKKIGKIPFILILIFAVILGFVNSYIIYNFNYIHKFDFDFSINFNIINVLYSILIFILFINLKFEKKIQFFSNYTFYIYLIHPFIISIIVRIVPMNFIICNPYISFVLIFIIVFICSLIFSIIFDYVYKFILKSKEN